MMLIRTLLFFSLVCIYVCLPAQPKTGSFSDDMYKKHDWKTFYQLPEVNKKIDLVNPDIELLNAAVFYVTNEYREKNGHPPFVYSYELRNSASFHSEQMAEKKFFNLRNTKDTLYLTPTKRINHFGAHFVIIGENISKITVMDYEKPKYTTYRQDDSYKYYYPNGKDEIETETYLEFARKVLDGLLHVKDYKINILYSKFEYAGCGVALVPDPFKSKKLPLAYVTQDFGGYKK